MGAPSSRTRTVRDGSSPPRWELHVRRPAPAVSGCARDYCGYVERADGFTRRRELPAPQAVLIFDFGPPLRVAGGPAGVAVPFRGGFVAGVGDTFTMTEHDGVSRGIQVNLTPIGARRLLGVPMGELANRVVALDDVLPAADRGLSDRLAEAPDWDARFDLIDAFLARRLARSDPAASTVAWAYGRIEATSGLVDIGALSRETGYCHKHLITLFREHVGLPPKLVARLVRFDGVMRRLRAGRPGTWAAIAAEHGFYDQAHLVRELRHFSGLSPSEAAAQMADVAGLFPD